MSGWRACVAVAVLGGASAVGFAAGAGLVSGGGVTVDDYLNLKRVTQLALSPDGTTAAYVISANARATPERANTTTWLQPTAKGGAAVALTLLNDARGLVWTADSRELAFISSQTGIAQVFAYDIRTDKTRQLTHSTDAVLSFRISPDGKSLAYITRAASPPSQSLFKRLMEGERGVVVDSNRLSVYDFLNPDNDSSRHPLPAVLHVALPGAAAFDAAIPGEPGSDVNSYYWSPDGRYLAITYRASDLRPSLLAGYRTSLGTFDVRTRLFRVLGKAVEPDGLNAGTRYSGGEWLPGGHEVLVRRVTETDPWVSPSYPDWAVADVTAGLPTQPERWKPVAVYGSGTQFVPASQSRVLLETTQAGVRSLFELTRTGLTRTGLARTGLARTGLARTGLARSALLGTVDGSSFLFAFDRTFTSAVFVHESLTQPPEIYFWKSGRTPHALTQLNDDIAKRVPYTARDIAWQSSDGATVHGWLLEPSAGAAKRPWPMLTHVHGGPGFAVTDSFAPYFDAWPFPLEVLASRGVAVFVPNYRGTQTYGRAHASPRRTDREPVEDIVTGVRTLVASGFADATRLGISGHSHGGWLGPMVMTREHVFRASSFAEGSPNEVVGYELMPGDLNRQVHDSIMGLGTSMWDDPALYLEGSPDLHFKGVRTASLWEAGSRSLSVMMMGFPKVAQHFGLPTEYVVYPKTGHNPDLPAIQRESADRNLDWFLYWLMGTEDSAPDKQAQYARWHQLRAESSIWREKYPDVPAQLH